MTRSISSLKIKVLLEQRPRNVEVIGRITKTEPVSSGTKRLVKATLEDDTGSIILNLWGPQADQCKVGDLVRVRDAYTKIYMGVLELNSWEDIEVLEGAQQSSP